MNEATVRPSRQDAKKIMNGNARMRYFTMGRERKKEERSENENA